MPVHSRTAFRALRLVDETALVSLGAQPARFASGCRGADALGVGRSDAPLPYSPASEASRLSFAPEVLPRHEIPVVSPDLLLGIPSGTGPGS